MNTGHFVDADYPVIDGVVRVATAVRERMERRLGPSWLVAPRHPGGVRDEWRIGYPSVPFRRPYRMGLPGLDPTLMGRLRDASLDVCHSHSPFGAGGLAVRAARAARCPVVFSMHSRYPTWSVARYREDPRWLSMIAIDGMWHGRLDQVPRVRDLHTVTDRGIELARLGTERMISRYCQQVDCVLVATERLRDELCRFEGMGGVDGKMPRVEVVLHGIDFPERGTGASVRARHGVEAHVPLLLYVGQLTPEKEVFFLVDAVARLAALGRDFRLLVVGDGPSRQALERRARERGIGHRCTFVGVIERKASLADYYAQADLFVFPSLYETQGLVAMEAGSFGLPLVGQADAPGLADVYRDGESAFFSKRSPVHYAALLASLCRNLERARAVGEVARRRTVRIEHTVDAMCAVYEGMRRETSVRSVAA